MSHYSFNLFTISHITKYIKSTINTQTTKFILKEKGQKSPEENTPNLTKTKGNKVQNTFKLNKSHMMTSKNDIKANKK